MEKDNNSQILEEMIEDDFYQACLDAGIEVQDGEELPEGIGAIWVPRLKAPSTTDKNWIHYTAGGYNYCIKIEGKSCLPNCVGYAWGRWRELLGAKHNLSRADAERWYNTNDGYKRGKTPKLGAVICWRRGNAYDDSDGMGHVAIVEKINADGSITCSNSAYYSTRFWLSTHKPPYHFGQYTFQGFIYNPINYEDKAKLDEDGEFGKLSIAAMQKWLGTTQDGIISDQLSSIKRYAPAILSYDTDGGGSQMIKVFQNYLIKKGIAAPTNGYVDENTVRAWQRWLREKQGYNIVIDGIFGEESALAMQKFLNKVL